MTLEELADRSGVRGRTIRYYQSKGVLPKPAKVGRDAVYEDEHLDRLRLVAELQDRGLSLDAIKSLVASRSRAVLSVGEWLGLDETLRRPWSEDRPRLLDGDELSQAVGDGRAGLVAELERTGYIERRPGDQWFVSSPVLLELALRLADAGVDVGLSARARDLLRRRLHRAADDLIELFTERVGDGFAGRGSEQELTAALETLRPVARESAGVILAQEIERAVGAMLESGPPRRRRR